MAYRRSRGKAKKIQPASTLLRFKTQVASPGEGPGIPGVTETYFVDLAQCMSIVNRRFYRQGLQIMVKSVKILAQTLNSGGTYPTGIPAVGKVRLSSLPKTWVMSNSWEKGFRAWQKMNKEALQEVPSAKPKFLDFKIYADVDHFTAGAAANLIPRDLNGNEFTVGEWEYSKVVVPDTDEGDIGGVNTFEIMAVGDNYNGGTDPIVGLINGYGLSRALPQRPGDPNLPAGIRDVDEATPENWLSAIFNEGTQQVDEVINDMFTENNEAPYPYENDGTNSLLMYPGGPNQAPTLELVDQELITTTTIGGTTFINGGIFPCGLMRFDLTNNTLSSAGELMEFEIQVELVPGNHRGYLCEPMTEM